VSTSTFSPFISTSMSSKIDCPAGRRLQVLCTPGPEQVIDLCGITDRERFSRSQACGCFAVTKKRRRRTGNRAISREIVALFWTVIMTLKSGIPDSGEQHCGERHDTDAAAARVGVATFERNCHSGEPHAGEFPNVGVTRALCGRGPLAQRRGGNGRGSEKSASVR